MSDVLFCTETFWEAWGDQVRAIAPDIETVLLVGEEPVADTDLERITIAFFSHDAWPERAGNFFGVALRANNLAWLHSMSAGVDSPIFQMLKDLGVRLTNSSGSSSAPIARTVMMYLLALARDLPRMMRAQANAEWAWDRWSELEGKRVAVIGYGPIGEEVVRLTTAFGMQPVIIRRQVQGDETCPVRPLVELAAVMAEVDAVVLALPLNDDTRGIISADVIAAMQTHAFFINVGRGELVDQPALTEALASGKLGGAGLDVTDPEPLPADDPLWALPNVIITPHNSGSTDGTARRASERFLANLTPWVASGELLSEV
ncbi:MAG: D-2-hydroxyacid dehydrogenase [Actinomycetota bacterium]|jgi:D-2-hydroxyacid dehydrogenase (NADP+)|uniref:D-2-hydroxyacid dehydrogenase n=1 Tax=uncultured Ilumatobacter sp. TaxID=879968 RepID=UPI00374F5031|nr:D-2-hydroxyacid dehydrogenase [Actinomycetota bacterium]